MRKKEVTERIREGRKEELPTVTYSRIASFLRCPMEEYYRFRVEGVGIESTTVNIPFLEGEFLHYALKHFHKSHRMLRDNLLKRVAKIINRAKEETGGLPPEEDDALEVKLAAMVGACLGYKSRYHDEINEFETLYLEEPFQFELGGYLVLGVIDRINRNRESDKLFLWENKSASRIAQDTYVVLPMSLQDLIYCEGCLTLMGEYPDFRARDFIIKSNLRRKKDKSGGRESLAQFEARVTQQYLDEPEKKFFRPPPIKVLKGTIESVKKQLLHILTMLQDSVPFMNFESCSGMYGRACPFVNACVAKLQGHKDGWDSPECRGLYRLKEELHPELSKEKEEKDAKEKS
jgi:hypothetical protein